MIMGKEARQGFILQLEYDLVAVRSIYLDFHSTKDGWKYSVRPVLGLLSILK